MKKPTKPMAIEVPAAKGEVRGAPLKPKEKAVFASELKRGNCAFGKVPVVDPDHPPIYNFAPASLCSIDGVQYLTRFPNEWYHYEWTHAVALKKPGHLVGIFDFAIEGGMASVPVFKTTNAGKSWLLMGNIEKPHFAARIKSLDYFSEDLARAVMDWDEKDYSVLTRDGGKTWTAPSADHEVKK